MNYKIGKYGNTKLTVKIHVCRKILAFVSLIELLRVIS